MPIVTLDFGSKVDMLNKSELAEALAEDARLRAIVAGVKQAEWFVNIGTIGASASVYTTPGNLVGNGFVWSVMNIGFEVGPAAGSVRVYKGIPNLGAANAPTGNGRFVNVTQSGAVSSAQFSKGQFVVRPGDQLTFAIGNANFLLSAFISAIEVPAERQGELWL